MYFISWAVRGGQTCIGMVRHDLSVLWMQTPDNLYVDCDTMAIAGEGSTFYINASVCSVVAVTGLDDDTMILQMIDSAPAQDDIITYTGDVGSIVYMAGGLLAFEVVATPLIQVASVHTQMVFHERDIKAK